MSPTEHLDKKGVRYDFQPVFIPEDASKVRYYCARSYDYLDHKIAPSDPQKPEDQVTTESVLKAEVVQPQGVHLILKKGDMVEVQYSAVASGEFAFFLRATCSGANAEILGQSQVQSLRFLKSSPPVCQAYPETPISTYGLFHIPQSGDYAFTVRVFNPLPGFSGEYWIRMSTLAVRMIS